MGCTKYTSLKIRIVSVTRIKSKTANYMYAKLQTPKNDLSAHMIDAHIIVCVQTSQCGTTVISGVYTEMGEKHPVHIPRFVRKSPWMHFGCAIKLI